MSAPLWTVDDVKLLQLRITDAAHDADVAEKLAAGQDLVLTKLGSWADPTWTAETTPDGIKHAILLATATLYEIRGGGDDTAHFQPSMAAVDHLLALYRDLAIG